MLILYSMVSTHAYCINHTIFKGQLKPMFKKALFLFFAACLLFCIFASAVCRNAQLTAVKLKIRLNQIGFYPNAGKIAVVLIGKEASFSITDIK